MLATMNTRNLTLSQTEDMQLVRIAIILERCAVLAKCIQQLASDGPDESADSLICIELLAAQLGFHADLAREVTGKGACFGGAEDWMLPVGYFTPESSEV